jgi:hypothetical protein
MTLELLIKLVDVFPLQYYLAQTKELKKATKKN